MPEMKRATKAQLRQEITALRNVGGMMSNVCFNLGQRHDPMLPSGTKIAIDNYDVGLMAELRVKWDAIPRSEKCLK